MDQMASFESAEQLDTWFQTHHASDEELWVQIFKKASGVPSVTLRDCTEVSLAWGWIDGLGRSFDKDSYLVRLTPRRPRSIWSRRNTVIAEELIADGLMKQPGLAQVEAAKTDGRWERAYAGPAEMEIPSDFIALLEENSAAKLHYATLNQRSRFLIYLGLQTARTPKVRVQRIARFIAKLETGASLT